MKQETLEEAINREFPLDNSYKEREAMFIGAKWQQENDAKEIQLLREEINYLKRNNL